MDLDVQFDQYTSRKLRFLIDTGADINLTRTGITDTKYLTTVKHPLQITTASRSVMQGGEKEVECLPVMSSFDIDSSEEATYKLPVKFYEADIGVEGILCYEWLAMYDLVVRPFKNCLQKVDDISRAWVVFNGLRTTPVEVCGVSRLDTPFLTRTKPTGPAKKKDRLQGIPKVPKFGRMLDFFSGTGSLRKVFQNMGYEVILMHVGPRP